MHDTTNAAGLTEAGAGTAAEVAVRSWAPVDACTLPTAEQPVRVAEFDALFARALRGVDRREPGWLRLTLDAGARVETSARELIARESACCSFFDFELTRTDGLLVLDVRVPDTRIDVLDGIIRRAAAAGSVA